MLRVFRIFLILLAAFAMSGCVKNFSRQILTEPTSFYSNNPHLYISFAKPLTYIGDISSKRYIEDREVRVIGREQKEAHLFVDGKNDLVEEALLIELKALDNRWYYNPLDKNSVSGALHAEDVKLAGNTYHSYVELLHNAKGFAQANGLVKENTSLIFKEDYLVCTMARIHRSNEIILIYYATPVPATLQGTTWVPGMLTKDQKDAVLLIRSDAKHFLTFHEEAPISPQQ